MNISDLPADGSRAQFAPFLPAMPDNGLSVARLHFESLGELAKYLPAKKPGGRGAEYWASGDMEFYGCTMADAQRMARNGWQEGAERVQPLLDRVKTARPTRKAMTRFDVAGAVAVIPRYLAGNPLAMRTRQISATNQQPVLTLVSVTSAPWWTSTDTFERLACAAAAIVDRLEDAGFRVEIIAGRRESSNSTGCGAATGENNALGNRAEMFFRAKAAQDQLDLSRVAFSLGHPGVHRRLLFAACTMHNKFNAAIGGNQGFAVALAPLERPPGVYVLPPLAFLEKQVEHDPIAVFDCVIGTLKTQGCPGLE